MARKITFLVLLTIFSTVLGIDSKDKFVNNTEPCDSKVYEGLELCCAMPKLFHNDSFKACLTSQVTKLQQYSARRRTRTRQKRAQQNQQQIPSDSGSGTIIMRRAAGPLGGPMCILQCVFERERLVRHKKLHPKLR